MVVFTLACTIVHGVFRQLHPPFASTLTNLLSKGYMRCLGVLTHWLDALHSRFQARSALGRHIRTTYRGVHKHLKYLQANEHLNVSEIQIYHVTAYHSIMSQTYDDNLLDDGSSALKAILQVTPDVGEKASAQSMMDLVAYLFTPAASRRSAMTAARAIHDYKSSEPGMQIQWLLDHT
jgi:hypothetical protein